MFDDIVNNFLLFKIRTVC